MTNFARLLALVLAGSVISGCAVVSVVDTAVSVTATAAEAAVDVTAGAVEGAVDVVSGGDDED